MTGRAVSTTDRIAAGEEMQNLLDSVINANPLEKTRKFDVPSSK